LTLLHPGAMLCKQGVAIMADFVTIKVEHGYELINLDVVRHITENGGGEITLHFDLTHQMTLNRENSTHVMSRIGKAHKDAA
jgi:hypothetical protein